MQNVPARVMGCPTATISFNKGVRDKADEVSDGKHRDLAEGR